MPLRRCAIRRDGRIRLCGQLPLFQLPTTTGSAFKPFAGIERNKLVLTQGEGNLLIFGDQSGHDAHCGLCGSLLYSLVREATFFHVAMGTLVDEPSIRPSAHIFVGSKASWFTITDELPQYEEHVVAAKTVDE